MAYEILEHTADAGVRGRGATLEEAFAEAARGMFSLMGDLEAVRPQRKVQVGIEEDSLEGLLVRWLAELLAQRDIEGLLFSRFRVYMELTEGRWKLSAYAWGEPMDADRHKLQVEVKAATNYGVRVEKVGNEFLAQCVLDL